jgi:NADH-quinone oxidoreductase subunit B
MLTAVDWFEDGSVYVVDLALACCALESQAAAGARPHVPVDEVPDDARLVLSLSGTLTTPMEPAVRAAVEALPSRPTVVAFGACAIAGGPYWDSYSVAKGAGDVVHIDHFVAGCPPPPHAFEDIVEAVRHG